MRGHCTRKKLNSFFPSLINTTMNLKEIVDSSILSETPEDEALLQKAETARDQARAHEQEVRAEAAAHEERVRKNATAAEAMVRQQAEAWMQSEMQSWATRLANFENEQINSMRERENFVNVQTQGSQRESTEQAARAELSHLTRQSSYEDQTEQTTHINQTNQC